LKWRAVAWQRIGEAPEEERRDAGKPRSTSGCRCLSTDQLLFGDFILLPGENQDRSTFEDLSLIALYSFSVAVYPWRISQIFNPLYCVCLTFSLSPLSSFLLQERLASPPSSGERKDCVNGLVAAGEQKKNELAARDGTLSNTNA
jgi:hypothetical protein